jgi:hypothetical protein
MKKTGKVPEYPGSNNKSLMNINGISTYQKQKGTFPIQSGKTRCWDDISLPDHARITQKNTASLHSQTPGRVWAL